MLSIIYYELFSMCLDIDKDKVKYKKKNRINLQIVHSKMLFKMYILNVFKIKM